jgi:hypothetical protein
VDHGVHDLHFQRPDQNLMDYFARNYSDEERKQTMFKLADEAYVK